MNPHVMRASDLIGLPIVSISAGEDVAEVRDVVFSAEEQILVGFTLNKRGLFAGRLKDVLPASSLAALGRDAVMIADETAITDSGTPDALGSKQAGTSVIGHRVLSAAGHELGTVVGVIISAGPAPSAVGYEIDATDQDDNLFVPISAQVALSEDNLLLPADATDFVRNDLAGFGAAIDTYRQSTMHEDRQ